MNPHSPKIRLILGLAVAFIALLYIAILLVLQNPPRPRNAHFYTAIMEEKIKSHWHPPCFSRSVIPVFTFKIGARGEVTDIHTKTSSGDPKFDQACINAIQAASPLPPLSKDILKDAPVATEFTFAYNIRKETTDSPNARYCHNNKATRY